MEYFESHKPQNITKTRRAEIISKTVIAKMRKLQRPHTTLVQNNSIDAYLQEITDILNDRLPHLSNEDLFVDLLRKVWSETQAKHKSTFFFGIADIMAAANKVGSEYYRKHVQPFQPQVKMTNPKDDQERVFDRSDPRKNGYTIEKCLKHIEDARKWMADGSLQRSMGQSFIRMHEVTIQRIRALEGQE